MSISAIDAVSKARLTPSGLKFTLLALANYADEAAQCWPSVTQLASWTSQGNRTVRDHLDQLEAFGLIERVRVRNDDGTLGRYRYQLHLDQLPQQAERRRPAAKSATGKNQPAANFARGEKQPPPAANFAALLTVNEPSKGACARPVDNSTAPPAPTAPPQAAPPAPPPAAPHQAHQLDPEPEPFAPLTAEQRQRRLDQLARIGALSFATGTSSAPNRPGQSPAEAKAAEKGTAKTPRRTQNRQIARTANGKPVQSAEVARP